MGTFLIPQESFGLVGFFFTLLFYKIVGDSPTKENRPID